MNSQNVSSKLNVLERGFHLNPRKSLNKNEGMIRAVVVHVSMNKRTISLSLEINTFHFLMIGIIYLDPLVKEKTLVMFKVTSAI